MLKSFLIYDALGISEERAAEITKQTFAAFSTCDNDMLKLCKAVAEKHDPEAVLVGVLLEHVCATNTALHVAQAKTAVRRRFS